MATLIAVYRRGDAVSQGDKRFYQARLKIDGRIGFKTVSLKTRNYEDAVAKAKTLYLQFSQAVSHKNVSTYEYESGNRIPL
jgi:hypothetical protein